MCETHRMCRNGNSRWRPYFALRLRFASRTPATPPFSGINSTPALSSAALRSSKVPLVGLPRASLKIGDCLRCCLARFWLDGPAKAMCESWAIDKLNRRHRPVRDVRSRHPSIGPASRPCGRRHGRAMVQHGYRPKGPARRAAPHVGHWHIGHRNSAASRARGPDQRANPQDQLPQTVQVI
jgi:hypothetical protein